MLFITIFLSSVPGKICDDKRYLICDVLMTLLDHKGHRFLFLL